MARKRWTAWLLGALLAPGPASALSLVVDRLDTPDVVSAGDRVSFSFALSFDPDEILEATQADISAPHLGGFEFGEIENNPWDLISTFKLAGWGNPMWVHVEDSIGGGRDPRGVTWDEAGGLAPLGSFSAVATYNGEIAFDLGNWVVSLLGGEEVPLAPEWAHIRTGVTIVGGSELPPPPPPAPAAPPPVVYPPTLTPDPPPPGEPIEGPGLHVDRRLVSDGRIDGVMPRVQARFVSPCSSELPCAGDIRVFPAWALGSRADFESLLDEPGLAPGELAGGAVPEPRTAVFMGLAGLLLAVRRRRSMRCISLAWSLAALLPAAPARAVSLIVDQLDTPDVVNAGDRVSFSFALSFGPEEILECTQADIAAPHLSGFEFEPIYDNPWDLSSTFRVAGWGNPMWVHAENALNSDPKGVTWDEVGGLAPLGSFSAIATYNGEIEFNLGNWVLSPLFGPDVPIAPEWEHIRTGVTIVGGSELPPPPPAPVQAPPAAPPAPPPPDPPPPLEDIEVRGEPRDYDVVVVDPGFLMPVPTLEISDDFLIRLEECEADPECGPQLHLARRHDVAFAFTTGLWYASNAYSGAPAYESVPEPPSAALLGLAALLAALRRARPE
jgi:hypothetical protein